MSDLTDALALAYPVLTKGHADTGHDLVPPVQVARPLGGSFNSNGYGDWKYTPWMIRKKVEALARTLPRFMAEHDADFIAVRGTSGTFIAGALQMSLDVPIMMMRKRGEQSHGSKIEGDTNHSYKRGIILDDSVCTGGTVQGMMEDLEPEPCKIVAILEHMAAHDCDNPYIALKGHCEGGYPTVNGMPVHLFRERK